MKKTGFVLVAVFFAANAYAATAYFTGQMEMVQSVTGRMVWNCQYQYAGQYFWRAFSGTCPSSVQVQ